MSKHTPGPFYLRETYKRPDGDYASLIFQEIPHNPSACIGVLIQSGAVRSGKEAEANARLLAAAADMRAALRALLDWGRDHTSRLEPNSPHDLLIAADAALTKAGDPTLPEA